MIIILSTKSLMESWFYHLFLTFKPHFYLRFLVVSIIHSFLIL